MSFLSALKTIGNDIEKGIAIAEPIVGTFIPASGPILIEIASIITALEKIGKPVSTETISQIVQALTISSMVKQHAATLPTLPPTFTITTSSGGGGIS